MFKLRKKGDAIITTRDLSNYILTTDKIPTTVYSKSAEFSYICKPRGLIFAKLKRRKPLKQ